MGETGAGGRALRSHSDAGLGDPSQSCAGRLSLGLRGSGIAALHPPSDSSGPSSWGGTSSRGAAPGPSSLPGVLQLLQGGSPVRHWRGVTGFSPGLLPWLGGPGYGAALARG